MTVPERVTIVGGGLAGCEAAWQIAQRGFQVLLYEMRPGKMTPAHCSGCLAELVCSSSLKSDNPSTAHGELKHEMRLLGSLVIECAEGARVPGGDALCVDRDTFAERITDKIVSHPSITIVREEISEIPEDVPTIIATGPLTSDPLCLSISELTGAKRLHFFDAIAPSVWLDSIDQSKVFVQSRYDKGEAAYINCPMDARQYEAFVNALLEAEKAEMHLPEEENPQYFEGCLPIEVMASRGRETLSHGTMKPVGLTDPVTGRRPHAVIQLRQENAEGTVWGLVGFQTQLKQGEQERVFRMIPGLENARFVRLGSCHRNTYIDSPTVLDPTLECRLKPGLFFAGQLVGVEGYMESAASGIISGINAARLLQGLSLVTPPRETVIGSLLSYISSPPVRTFQPMNSNFGILPEPQGATKKKDRATIRLESARAAIEGFVKSLNV